MILRAFFPAVLLVCASPASAQVKDQEQQSTAGFADPAPSSADPLVWLLNTPETFDVLRKHIPFFVNLTEHGLIPAFSTQMTLDDLLNVPEARVTPENIRAINAELARLHAATSRKRN